MIYITGDISEYGRLSNKDLFRPRDQNWENMTREDCVIVCGKSGIHRRDAAGISHWDSLSELPFQVLFIDGCSDDYGMLSGKEFEVPDYCKERGDITLEKFETVEFCGGFAHKIRDNVYHLMRGYVFSIQGKTFFAFGGESSRLSNEQILNPESFDQRCISLRNGLPVGLNKKVEELRGYYKSYKIKGVDWWPEEMPNSIERNRGLQNLIKYGNKVDYIITRCSPSNIARLAGDGYTDAVTDYLDRIQSMITFDKWFCGAYPQDTRIMDKYYLLNTMYLRLI